jgi:AraC family L-rhamnose operon regulatory protein RhaS
MREAQRAHEGGTETRAQESHAAPLVWARPHFTDTEIPVRVQRLRQADLHLHRHEFTELVLVVEGSGDQLFDAHHVPIASGDAFVIDVNHAHGYRATRDLDIVNVLFDEGFLLEREPSLAAMPSYQALVHLEPLARRRLEFGAKLRLDSVSMSQARTLAREMERELSDRGEGYVARTVALLVELIVLLCRSYGASEGPAQRGLADVGRVVGYLEHHYDEQISLADMARIAAMSERSLLRKFSAATGTTPIQYLLQVRIAHGTRLLRTTSLSITEIAGLVGFEDGNYFARTFRRELGVSPREYRASGIEAAP